MCFFAIVQYLEMDMKCKKKRKSAVLKSISTEGITMTSNSKQKDVHHTKRLQTGTEVSLVTELQEQAMSSEQYRTKPSSEGKAGSIRPPPSDQQAHTPEQPTSVELQLLRVMKMKQAEWEARNRYWFCYWCSFFLPPGPSCLFTHSLSFSLESKVINPCFWLSMVHFPELEKEIHLWICSATQMRESCSMNMLQCQCEIVRRLIFQKCLGLDGGQALCQNQCSKGPDFQGQKNACHSSTQKEEWAIDFNSTKWGTSGHFWASKGGTPWRFWTRIRSLYRLGGPSHWVPYSGWGESFSCLFIQLVLFGGFSYHLDEDIEFLSLCVLSVRCKQLSHLTSPLCSCRQIWECLKMGITSPVLPFTLSRVQKWQTSMTMNSCSISVAKQRSCILLHLQLFSVQTDLWV